MAEYYLISQLPALDAVGDNAPLPITQEWFDDLCQRHLSGKALAVLQELTLLPPRDCETDGSGFVEAWNAAERGLRLALAKVRAEKMNKVFETGSATLTQEQMKVAADAIQLEDPMEAEKYLTRCRLTFLDNLRPTDPFALDYVFYYGLKLKLLLRIRNFDTAAGKAAYRNIYDSIVGGDTQEVTQ